MIIYDKNGSILLDIEVDDTSVRYKVIKGENSLTLKFSLAEHLELPLGAFCEFKNEKYTLMQPEDFTMHHRRSFEYSVIMYSEDAKAKRYMFVNPVDGRLKFSLTAKPEEHLQMFVDNLNSRDSGWSVGECPDHVEIVLSYNHTTCHDALVQLANELELDYWFEGKVVNLGKLELYKDNPLPLSYGGDGEGLKPNIKRTNYTEALPVEILYVQGTDVNIDPSKYGSAEMHLPKSQTLGYDGEHFDNENGFNQSEARYYKTDDKGYYIRRADKDVNNFSEDSLDCTEIEPTKEETILSVIEVDAEDHFYDIVFDSTVDYSKYVIEGEKATIVFQSGMLAGKEFDLATDRNGKLICKKDENGHWRVEIVPQQIDGITMPDKDSNFIPVGGENGDKFKVFGIQLPTEFIADNETKTGAEWDMFRYAVKHFYNNEDVQYTISGELDEIYAKGDWENIEGRLKLGAYVSFTDKSFQEEPLLIRITGIKEYVNKPHSPFLEISNAAIAGSLIGSINKIENQEAYTEEKIKDARRFTKRTFAEAQRAIKLLEDAFGDGFDESIKPATVQTLMMLVGDESLQFSFVKAVGSDDVDSHNAYFDLDTKTFKCDAGVIKHYTLGVNEIRSSFDQKYHYWTMPEYESAVLDDASKDYYVYAVVNSEEDKDNEFRLEPSPIGIKDRLESEKRYYLLLGLLLAEHEGSRDFMSLYGFTQIQPGQITTDVIRSSDGEMWLDLLKGILHLNNNAGVSGVIDSEKGDKSIAAWFGGLMEDLEYDDDVTNPANTLFRHDGSGYLAKGNIKFNEKGEVELSPNIKISGTGNETLDSILTMLAVLNDMFYFADENTIGTKYNFFSEQENAAGGIGEETGETGGGGIVDTEMSDTSENAIANRVVKEYIDKTNAELAQRLDDLEQNQGSGEGDKNYYHSQGTAAEEWVIEHNLGKYPAVTVVSSAGEQIYCDVRFDSINKVTLSFGSPLSGAAFLN